MTTKHARLVIAMLFKDGELVYDTFHDEYFNWDTSRDWIAAYLDKSRFIKGYNQCFIM